MAPRRRDTNERTLREHLKGATAHSHDTLDSSMRPASDWRSLEDYARFLRAQYAARAPVEVWLSMFASVDLKPPEQTPLLAHDLAMLGQPMPTPSPGFAMTFNGEATATGVAWVLAGSSLGNRAMLHDMQRSLSGGSEWPHVFLSSHGMTAFWKTLKVRVEAPASRTDAEEATRAARCVFEHFLGVARSDAAARVLEDAL